jgi:hypothetical protein
MGSGAGYNKGLRNSKCAAKRVASQGFFRYWVDFRACNPRQRDAIDAGRFEVPSCAWRGEAVKKLAGRD